MMNTVKDTKKGNIARYPTHLVMLDLVKEKTKQNGPAKKPRGKNHIDGIWFTKDIDCHVARFLPLWYGKVDKKLVF